MTLRLPIKMYFVWNKLYIYPQQILFISYRLQQTLALRLLLEIGMADTLPYLQFKSKFLLSFFVTGLEC